ncbi:MAG: rRNA maturation RNase YbeY [Lachnospiraceae bacterium]|nr:rRNA maturation RNase YbeY [Lachnospiraceae bacterium]
MTLQIENKQEINFDFDYDAVAHNVIKQVLLLEQCPYEVEISLILTGSQEIQRLNKKFRKIDRETDVLSFPMVDFPTSADYLFLEKETVDCFHPETGELLLGDIVISVEKAQEQAEAYGHTLKQEYIFLIIHSMLHLLGYDHMLPQEDSVMQQKQEATLMALGIT